MPEQLEKRAIAKPPHRFPFLPLPFAFALLIESPFFVRTPLQALARLQRGRGLSVSCAHDAASMAALMASSRSSWPASLALASRSVMARFCSADSSRLVRNGLTPIRKGQLGQSRATHLRTS